MRVNVFLVPGIVIGVLIGTILVAQAAGVWSISGRTSVTIEKLAPADIKGWMTLQQIIDGVGLSKEELYGLAGIPDSVPVTTALKEVEKLVPGFETSTLRDALTARFDNSKANSASATPTQTVSD